MITVAIVGAGFNGVTHAQAYAGLRERARVKMVCGPMLERAEAVASKLGARAVTNIETILVDPTIDAVDICVPTLFHREVAERVLSRGKHVLLEKPIALTLQDADAIISAGEASGAIVMVGLTLRFWPEYAELARRVEARQLGEPMSISTYRISAPAAWNRWMSDPSRSGGIAVDLLVHDFDQMNRLLGDPQRVLARPVGPRHSATPGVLCLVDYGRSHAAAEGTMMAPESYHFSCGIRAVCNRGLAEYNFTPPIYHSPPCLSDYFPFRPGTRAPTEPRCRSMAIGDRALSRLRRIPAATSTRHTRAGTGCPNRISDSEPFPG